MYIPRFLSIRLMIEIIKHTLIKSNDRFKKKNEKEKKKI